MSEPDIRLTEKLNKINQKLVKYSSQKDADKETGLIESLKILKKKQDPDYSAEASGVLLKWKPLINGTNEKTENLNKSIKSENLSHDSKELALKVKSEPSVPKVASKTKSSKFEEDQKEPKKLKLSISDYKVKKEAKSNGHENEIKSRTNMLDTSNPTNDSHVNNRSLDIDPLSKSTLAVPKPTISLNEILSIKPKSTTDVCSNVNTSKYKNSFPTPTPSFSGSRQCIGGPSEDEVLSNIFSSKHSKKFLYTGKRANHDGGTFQPTRLFDLASRVLVDNLDDLPTRIATYNAVNDFPLAFDLIKPILERANAKQLQTIEYYSPHLLVDTDYMWKKLCEQDFKQQMYDREEDESWREYYFRKSDERELKFQKARAIVSKLQASKPKERQTQMATVKFVSGKASIKPTVFPPKTFDSGAKSKPQPAIKIPTESVPVRRIIQDTPGMKKLTSAVGSNPKKQATTAPGMSQGMKQTMKLIKKTIRR